MGDTCDTQLWRPCAEMVLTGDKGSDDPPEEVLHNGRFSRSRRAAEMQSASALMCLEAADGVGLHALDGLSIRDPVG